MPTELKAVEMKFTTSQGERVGDAFALFQNSPNPFKGETQIGYIMPEAGPVSMKLFDGLGKYLGELKADAEKGYNEMTITSRFFPAEVDNIIYYQLEANGYLATKKMVLIE